MIPSDSYKAILGTPAQTIQELEAIANAVPDELQTGGQYFDPATGSPTCIVGHWLSAKGCGPELGFLDAGQSDCCDYWSNHNYDDFDYLTADTRCELTPAQNESLNILVDAQTLIDVGESWKAAIAQLRTRYVGSFLTRRKSAWSQTGFPDGE